MALGSRSSLGRPRRPPSEMGWPVSSRIEAELPALVALEEPPTPSSSSAKSKAAYASPVNAVYSWTEREMRPGTGMGSEPCPVSPKRPSTCPASATFRAANSGLPIQVSRMSARLGMYC